MPSQPPRRAELFRGIGKKGQQKEKMTHSRFLSLLLIAGFISLSFSVGLYLRFFYHLFVEVKLQNEYEPFINGRKIIMRHRSDPEVSFLSSSSFSSFKIFIVRCFIKFLLMDVSVKHGESLLRIWS